MLYSGKLLLVSSDWEAFGLNIVEAGRHGIPTISKSVEGIPEVINIEMLVFMHTDEAFLKNWHQHHSATLKN